MKTKVQISDKSIETAGLPSDYKEAIAEFIWNSFDAKAAQVKIKFDDTNAIGNLTTFFIEDNGDGINFNNLSNTFGAFLDSEKKNNHQRTSYVHGKKGKGRFSFEVFASKATWNTTYFDDAKKKFINYCIEVDSSTKDYFAPSEKIELGLEAKNSSTKVCFESCCAQASC